MGVLVRVFNLSYHNKEPILLTVDPYAVTQNKLPQQRPNLVGCASCATAHGARVDMGGATGLPCPCLPFAELEGYG